MKNSKIWLMAYTTFLLASVALDIFYKNAYTGHIASAATVAGFFFGIADYYGWKEDSLNTNIKQIRLFIHSIEEYVNELTNYVNAHREDCSDSEERLLPYAESDSLAEKVLSEIADCKKNLEDDASGIEEWNTERIAQENIANELDNKRRNYAVKRDLSWSVGVLAFLIVCTYEPCVSFLMPYQNYVTIVSFSVIILCYIFRNKYDDEHSSDLFDYHIKKRIFDQKTGELKVKKSCDFYKSWTDSYLKSVAQ